MIHERIAKVITYSGLSQNQFCNRIDASPPAIHNIIKGRLSKPSFDILGKILRAYPEISTEWLITGEGEMWAKKNPFHGNKIRSNNLESRVLQLIEMIRNRGEQEDETYELGDWVELLVDTNREQKGKMMKLHERQKEIIKVLKKMKYRI